MLKSQWIEFDDQVLEISGAKKFSFLHGQLTNHIQGMSEQSVTFNFLLNNKGKIQAPLFVYRSFDHCFLAVPKKCAQTVKDHLEKLAPLSQVQVISRDDLRHVHTWDLELEKSVASFSPLAFIKHKLFNEWGVSLILPKKIHLPEESFLTSSEIERLFVTCGVPRYGVDYNDSHLPQETGLWQALHFDKGCYLGQEIVARLQYRGQVKKKLTPFTLDGKVDSSKAEIVNQNMIPVGEISSFVVDEVDNKTYGLAWVKTEYLNNENQLMIEGQPLHV